MDRGAWWATVHGVTESDMTERLFTFTSSPECELLDGGNSLSFSAFLTRSPIIFLLVFHLHLPCTFYLILFSSLPLSASLPSPTFISALSSLSLCFYLVLFLSGS